jgi:hypothetical protein
MFSFAFDILESINNKTFLTREMYLNNNHGLNLIKKNLKNSIKFKLPDSVICNDVNGKILNDIMYTINKFNNFLKLPYDNCWFEFNGVDDNTTHRIGVYTEEAEYIIPNDKLQPFLKIIEDYKKNGESFSNSEKKYLTNLISNPIPCFKLNFFINFGYDKSPKMVHVLTAHIQKNCDVLFQQFETKLESCGIRILTCDDGTSYSIGKDLNISFIQNDLSDKALTVMKLFFLINIYPHILINLLHINSRNTQIHNFKPKCFELTNNTKLTKKDLSYFEYKILDIYRTVPSIKSVSDIKKCNDENRNIAKHTVRGHFKNIKGTLYWWSSHTRNKHSKRTISKDYIIK